MAQVQGEEIYLSHSGQEVDDNIDEVVAARGSEASLSARLADIVGDFEADQQRQETEIGAVAALGAKNLLAYNGYGTGAENGVAYSINTDGTITVSGTPQGTSPSYIELKLNGNAANIARFCDGQHILSGCPAGGGDNKYRMYAARGGYSRFDYGDGVLLTETTQTDVRLVVFIANGYTANNLVFKPMIRRAEITDSTYEQYAPTNRELYEMILALQSGATAQSAASLMQAGRIDAAKLMQAGQIDAELTDAQEVTENDT